MDQEQIDKIAMCNLVRLLYASLPHYENKGLEEYIDYYYYSNVTNTIKVKGSNGASDLIITVSVVE